MSRFLHDHIEVGALFRTQPPAGDFVLAAPDEPTVLISAGVGITPLLAMLHELSHPDHQAPVWFFHGARHSGEHPFRDEVAKLASRRPNIAVHVAYSQPRPTDDPTSVGRIHGATVAAVVNNPRAHSYLCGPPPFMASIHTDLTANGIPPSQIHTESFGPH